MREDIEIVREMLEVSEQMRNTALLYRDQNVRMDYPYLRVYIPEFIKQMTALQEELTLEAQELFAPTLNNILEGAIKVQMAVENPSNE